ncbi:glycosyltransferase family 32 protein [Streptomyces sp. NPDC058740]|uniref:glycosyltransferase family 32 protein n=1 Tax=Streptomyces sp. NPDC058740 TaxID=3346619 RepID=UPI00369DDB4A
MGVPSAHGLPGTGEQHAAVEDQSIQQIIEDHRLRSAYLRELTRALSGHDGAWPTAPVPRVIVQFWDDPHSIPPDVSQCMRSWSALESQGFRREVYGDDSARAFIRSAHTPAHVAAFDACPHPAMRSDYFRLCYLAQRGGFYVDADDVYQGTDWMHLFRDSRLRVQALCYDTATDTMVDAHHAATTDEDPDTWIHYVNNNPIITPAHHPVIEAALEAGTRAVLSRGSGAIDIQSMTGPGNLTVALARYACEKQQQEQSVDVEILSTWDRVAVSRWPLSYRGDERNWRLWRQS